MGITIDRIGIDDDQSPEASSDRFFESLPTPEQLVTGDDFSVKVRREYVNCTREMPRKSDTSVSVNSKGLSLTAS